MKKNIGSADKTVRLVLGVVIIALGLYFQSWWGLVGLVPLLTSFTGTCPLYLLLDISTIKTNADMNKS